MVDNMVILCAMFFALTEQLTPPSQMWRLVFNTYWLADQEIEPLAQNRAPIPQDLRNAHPASHNTANACAEFVTAAQYEYRRALASATSAAVSQSNCKPHFSILGPQRCL